MDYYSSPLETIAHLTHRNVLDVSENQKNRYCVLLNSSEGKEAFYFSTPVYNFHSKKIVGRHFIAFNGVYQMVGSNCIVRVTNTEINFIKENKTASISWGSNIGWKLCDGCLRSNNISIIPTYNGVLIEGNIKKNPFNIKLNFNYSSIRNSHNCICFMESKFRPIFVVSSLQTQLKNNSYPLLVKFNKLSQYRGNIELYSKNIIEGNDIIEMSFYESKIIQDTPVSGKQPNENNAFGPIGFIGRSEFYGTQWLYSRLDIKKMPELHNKFITEIKLYIPRFNSSSTQLDVVELSNRFCSFGSNWSNKVQVEDKKHKTIIYGDYVCIDITKLYTTRGQLHESEGMVIIPDETGLNNYQVISTGDSYSAPPIIYVKYTNL